MYVEKLPKTVRAESIIEIFQIFEGFLEVRHIPEKGVAFVDFSNDDLAAVCLSEVKEQNLLVFQGENEMVAARIQFGKK